MKTILTPHWHEEAFIVNMTAVQITQETARGRIQLALRTLAQRQLHAANRAVRKGLRAAELALWQATGRDFLQTT